MTQDGRTFDVHSLNSKAGRFTTRWTWVVALGLFLCVTPRSWASYDVRTYSLDTSNTLPGGTSYGTVTIQSDTTLGVVTIAFTVDPQAVPQTLNNFGLQEIGLNTDLTLSANQVSADNGWSVSVGGSTNISSFGLFNLVATGSGSNRQITETITITGLGAQATSEHFTIGSLGSNGNLPSSGSQFFVAHEAGFGGGSQSTYIGGSKPPLVPVPEPKSFALVLIGAGLLSGLSFRRLLAV